MISLTTAEINAWIVAFFFPLTRTLALLVAVPPFNNVALPNQVRLLAGLAITVALTAALPKPPTMDPASAQGLLILAEQLLIGYAMGFTMRLVFAAIDLAGTLISNQMGLGFATAYDPQSTSQTAVISDMIGMIALLIFLAINGHLMMISTLVESFALLPIGQSSIADATWLNVAHMGGVVFSSGVFLSLPIVVTLTITNIALAILSRIAPQLNIMAVGFPVTIVLGFASLIIGMTYLGAPLLQLFEYGQEAQLKLFVR